MMRAETSRKPDIDTMVMWMSLACAAAGISACTVDSWNIDGAVKYCEAHGGVHHITTGVITYAVCVDGNIKSVEAKQ